MNQPAPRHRFAARVRSGRAAPRVASALVVSLVAAVSVLGAAAPAAASHRSAAADPAPITFDWRSATVTLPWRAATLSDGSRCPGGRITFTALGPPTENAGLAQRGDYTYLVTVQDTADVTRDGHLDQVVALQCQRGNAGMSWDYLYSYRRTPGGQRPVLRDFVTSSDFGVNAAWFVTALDARTGSIAVQQYVSSLGGTVDRVFRWTGHGLTPDQPLPGLPQADVAP